MIRLLAEKGIVLGDTHFRLGLGNTIRAQGGIGGRILQVAVLTPDHPSIGGNLGSVRTRALSTMPAP